MRLTGALLLFQKRIHPVINPFFKITDRHAAPPPGFFTILENRLVEPTSLQTGQKTINDKANLFLCFVNTVAKGIEITEKQAKQFIETSMESITKALKHGENIRLLRFSTFSAAKRIARIGHNPQTGAEIKIPKKQSSSLRLALLYQKR